MNDDNKSLENACTEKGKQDNIFKRGLNKVGNGFSKLAKTAYAGAKNFVDEVQAHKEWNKQFEMQSNDYTVLPLNFENDNEYYKHTSHIFAVKITEQKCLLIRSANKLNVGQVIFGKQNQFFQIEDFDEEQIAFPSDESQFPIYCQKYFYKPYSKPIIPIIQNITNNQNVTVGNNNSGDITLVADFSSQLAEIKSAIDTSKPNLFNKHKKDEAIKLYGKFENCIVNKQKDKPLFDKFVKILEVIAPAAVSIAGTIISCL